MELSQPYNIIKKVIQNKQMNNLEEFLRTFLKPELRMLLKSKGLKNIIQKNLINLPLS